MPSDLPQAIGGPLLRDLRETRRRVMGGPATAEPDGAPLFRQLNWQFVRVTGAVVTGYNPGKVTIRTEPDGAWSDLGDVWIFPLNGETLTVDTRYEAAESGNKPLNGEASSRPVFVAVTPC